MYCFTIAHRNAAIGVNICAAFWVFDHFTSGNFALLLIGVIFFFADGFFKPSFFLPIFYQNIKQLKYINNVYIIKKP